MTNEKRIDVLGSSVYRKHGIVSKNTYLTHM